MMWNAIDWHDRVNNYIEQRVEMRCRTPSPGLRPTPVYDPHEHSTHTFQTFNQFAVDAWHQFGGMPQPDACRKVSLGDSGIHIYLSKLDDEDSDSDSDDADVPKVSLEGEKKDDRRSSSADSAADSVMANTSSLINRSPWAEAVRRPQRVKISFREENISEKLATSMGEKTTDSIRAPAVLTALPSQKKVSFGRNRVRTFSTQDEHSQPLPQIPRPKRAALSPRLAHGTRGLQDHPEELNGREPGTEEIDRQFLNKSRYPRRSPAQGTIDPNSIASDSAPSAQPLATKSLKEAETVETPLANLTLSAQSRSGRSRRATTPAFETPPRPPQGSMEGVEFSKPMGASLPGSPGRKRRLPGSPPSEPDAPASPAPEEPSAPPAQQPASPPPSANEKRARRSSRMTTPSPKNGALNGAKKGA